MSIGKKNVSIWAVVFALVLSIHSYAAAANATKGKGVLTSIEDGKIVIIDEKGYEVSPLTQILDEEKKPISLNRISPPQKVYFEYESTKDGALITLLRVIPERIPR